MQKKKQIRKNKHKRMSIAEYQRINLLGTFLWNISIASFICLFIFILIALYHFTVGILIAIISCILVAAISSLLTWKIMKSLRDENIPK